MDVERVQRKDIREVDVDRGELLVGCGTGRDSEDMVVGGCGSALRLMQVSTGQ